MALVPYKLDVGFRTPAWTPKPLELPDGPGGGLFQFGENWKRIQEDLAATPDTFGAAFELENPVLNTIELLTKPTWEADPNFNLEAHLREAELWDEFRWNYVGVQSAGEFLYKTRQILKEQDAREKIAAAGPDGVVAMMVAGLISPTTLLPFIGPVKGVVQGVASGLAWGAAAGAIDEIPLQLNQELRTLEESGINIAFSAVVGGVLGGGVGYLNKRLDAVSGDMGVAPGTRYISPSEERVLIQRRLTETIEEPERAALTKRLEEVTSNENALIRAAEVDDAISTSAVGKKSAAGADTLEVNAGGLKGMLGIGERLTKLAGPVTAVLGQKISAQGQWMMAQLSTAGLRLEKNLILDSNGEIIGAIPSNAGGTVEGLIMSRKGDTLRQINGAYDNYADYMLGKGQSQGPFRRSRASTKGQVTANGKMNRRQFFEAVGEAMWKGDVSDIPEVQATAQSFRKYYDRLLKEAQDVGIISKEIAEITPDLSFLNRIYDLEAIKRNPGRFTKLLADHFEQALKGDIQKLHEAFVKSDQADRLRLADYDLPLEVAQKQREEALAELKVLNEAEDNPAAIEQLISDQRGKLRANTVRRKELERQLEAPAAPKAKGPFDEVLDRDTELYRGAGTGEASGIRDGSFKYQDSQLGIMMTPDRGTADYFAKTMPGRELVVGKLPKGTRVFVKDTNGDGGSGPQFREVLEAAGQRPEWATSRQAAIRAELLERGYGATKYTSSQKYAVYEVLDPALINGKAPSPRSARKTAEAEIETLRQERSAIREKISELEALGGGDLEARTLRKRELKAKIRNLNRSRFMVAERARAKYDKMEELEEQNIDALERVVQSGSRILKKIDAGDEKFDADLAGLRAAVAKAGVATSKWASQLEQIKAAAAKVVPKEGADAASVADAADDKLMDKIFSTTEKFDKATNRFDEITEELDSFQNIEWAEGGRAEVRGLLQDTLTESLERLNSRLSKRYERIAKLEKQADKFDAAGWAARRQEIVDRMRTRKEKLAEKRQALGDTDFNSPSAVANVSARAQEIADLARTRIEGINTRLAGFDAMADKRGTELARTLSIDSQVLAREGFLVTDAEHLLHTYANTLIPDMEIVKRLGAFAPDGERNLQFTKLNEEQFMTQRKLEAEFRAEAAKAGKPVNEEELGELMRGVGKEYDQIRENLDASIRRLRHQWGVPAKPDGFAARGVQTILAWQALRFLGGVAFSSLPDLGRPVMRYGLGRTFKNAWLPLISNWKAIKMTAEEARRAFVVVESATAHRTFQATEMMDLAMRQSKFESALKWTTSKIGILFLFAPWTDLSKTLSSMSLNVKMMESIDLAVNKTGSSAARKEAIEFLNSLGINDDLQRRMWDEMQNGGAERVKSSVDPEGRWVPQTDRWTDEEAVRAYRAALYSEGAASVITPGLELPKMANSSGFTKLLFNLKSFALASTSKTLMAGLQQRDAAVVNGIMISMALGAFGFYLKAIIAGGATEQRMRDASWEQWVDEALDASGLLGALSIGQRIAQDIPGVKELASVSGVSGLIQGKPADQSLRSSGAGLIEDVAGPSADLAFTLAQTITGVDNPTRAQVHRIRQLLPFQNVFYLRRLFDQLENTVGDAANLEGQRR